MRVFINLHWQRQRSEKCVCNASRSKVRHRFSAGSLGGAVLLFKKKNKKIRLSCIMKISITYFTFSLNLNCNLLMSFRLQEGSVSVLSVCKPPACPPQESKSVTHTMQSWSTWRKRSRSSRRSWPKTSGKYPQGLSSLGRPQIQNTYVCFLVVVLRWGSSSEKGRWFWTPKISTD